MWRIGAWLWGRAVDEYVLLWKHALAGLGGGVHYHAARIPGGEGAPSLGRFYPHLNIQLGYAF